MKKYTHAWLAFKAIERLETASVPSSNRPYADRLIRWFQSHKDGVIQGAWYPDMVIKDMANSHVLKRTPSQQGESTFRTLPSSSLIYREGRTSDLHGRPYVVDPADNLPERCESLAHSVIDNLKMQEMEPKGSPIAPTDNHVAVILFMLSHYVADAHMPLHCDGRRFSSGIDLHGLIEEQWEDAVKEHFAVDYANERFFYNPQGYPLSQEKPDYADSFLQRVEEDIRGRSFSITWGQGNDNVGEFTAAVCQYSYLVSYLFVPPDYDETNVTAANWQSLPGQRFPFDELSFLVLSDAVDAIARIWLRVWRRYMQWKEQQGIPE